MRSWGTLPIAIVILLAGTRSAGAHGANINYALQTGIEIVATFDSGEPMAKAQVTVYAPQDPTAIWLTGTCDEQGRFVFVPDTAQTGMWTVSVRLAGHGDIIHIPVEESMIAPDTGQGSSYSTGQILLMSISVVWGFIGTALFFKKRG